MTEEAIATLPKLFNVHTIHTISAITTMMNLAPPMEKKPSGLGRTTSLKEAAKGLIAMGRITKSIDLRPDLQVLTGHEQGGLTARNIDSGIVTGTANFPHKIRDMCVTPTLVYVIVEGGRGTGQDQNDVFVRELSKLEQAGTKLTGHTSDVTCVKVSPNNEHRVVTGSLDKTVIIWDSTIKRGPLHICKGHIMMITKVEIIYEIIFSGSTDASVRTWDLDTGASLHSLSGHQGPIRYLKKHGDSVFSGCGGSVLKIWGSDGTSLFEAKLGNAAIQCVSVSNPLICTGAADHTVTFHNKDTRTQVSLTGHCAPVRTLNNDAPRKLLLSGSDEGLIIVWDWAPFMTDKESEPVKLLITHPHQGPINAIIVDHDKNGSWERILTCSSDHTIFILDFNLTRNSRTWNCLSKMKSIEELQDGWAASVEETTSKVKLWDTKAMAVKPEKMAIPHRQLMDCKIFTDKSKTTYCLTAGSDNIQTWVVEGSGKSIQNRGSIVLPGMIIAVSNIFFDVDTQTDHIAVAYRAMAIDPSVECALYGICCLNLTDMTTGTSAQSHQEVQRLLYGQSGVVIQYVDGVIAVVFHNMVNEAPEKILVEPEHVETRGVPTLFGGILQVTTSGLCRPAMNFEGDRLLFANGPQLQLWRFGAGSKIKKMWTAPAHSHISCVDFVRHSDLYAVTGTDEGMVALWSIDGQCILEIKNDGFTMTKEEQQCMIRRSSVDSRRRKSFTNLERKAGSSAGVSALHVDLATKFLIIGLVDGVVLVWDLSQRRTARRFHAFQKEVIGLSVLPSDSRIVSWCSDKVRWDVLEKRYFHTPSAVQSVQRNRRATLCGLDLAEDNQAIPEEPLPASGVSRVRARRQTISGSLALSGVSSLLESPEKLFATPAKSEDSTPSKDTPSKDPARSPQPPKEASPQPAPGPSKPVTRGRSRTLGAPPPVLSLGGKSPRTSPVLTRSPIKSDKSPDFTGLERRRNSAAGARRLSASFDVNQLKSPTLIEPSSPQDERPNTQPRRLSANINTTLALRQTHPQPGEEGDLTCFYTFPATSPSQPKEGRRASIRQDRSLGVGTTPRRDSSGGSNGGRQKRGSVKDSGTPDRSRGSSSSRYQNPGGKPGIRQSKDASTTERPRRLSVSIRDSPLTQRSPDGKPRRLSIKGSPDKTARRASIKDSPDKPRRPSLPPSSHLEQPSNPIIKASPEMKPRRASIKGISLGGPGVPLASHPRKSSIKGTDIVPPLEDDSLNDLVQNSTVSPMTQALTALTAEVSPRKVSPGKV